MNVHWYPGHMARAGREIEEHLSKVDVVAEIVDARIPISSRNQTLHNIIKNKPLIVVLNRMDQAAQVQNAAWINYFNERQIPALCCDSKSGRGINTFHRLVKNTLKEKLERRKERGLGGISHKVMVVGIPNVGKSSFINRLSGRKPAKAEDRPGITRKISWIRLRSGLDLLDTPGILPPQLEPRQAGLHLAFTGAIRDEILDPESLSLELLLSLNAITPKNEMIDNLYNQSIKSESDMLSIFAKNRGYLLKGGIPDLERAGIILLDEYRAGKLGRMTLEPVGYNYPSE